MASCPVVERTCMMAIYATSDKLPARRGASGPSRSKTGQLYSLDMSLSSAANIFRLIFFFFFLFLVFLYIPFDAFGRISTRTND